MQKVYLLLRSNQQTGPYTIEELNQLGLKTNDLIWVEGKSAGWSYPSEIEELIPFLSPHLKEAAMRPEVAMAAEHMHDAYMPPPTRKTAVAKAAAPHKIFISLPGQAATATAAIQEPSPEELLEQKAEMLRRRAQAYKPENKVPADSNPVTTKYARSLADIEEDYTSWVYQQKTKKKAPVSRRNLTIAGIGVILLMAGYGITKLVTSKSAEPQSVAAKNNPQALLSQPATEEPPPTEPAENKAKSTIPANTKIERKTIVEHPATKSKKVTYIPVRQSTSKAAGPEINSKMEAAETTTNTNRTSADIKKSDAPEATAQKKTLGEKIDGFLDKLKRKKTKNAPAENPQTPNTTDAGGERKAIHRGDGTTATEANLANYIDITPSEPQDNWMMGIHGLKITVRNRSSQTVQNAAVEVRYYNDQQELLDKKIINIANIPPGQSANAAVPDHRLADHTDYQLLSAN